MPRRLPSSALDSQTLLTASGTGAVLAANWYIGTSGLGAGAVGAGQVVGTLNGPLTGTADSAKVLTPGKALNGVNFTGSVDITVPVNTTSISTSGTYYPLFVPSSSSGNQQASTSAASGFTFDPNTKNLVVAGTLSGSNLSGTNTGDETSTTIKTKLGITTLSGSNTGDQDLSGYLTTSSASSTYAPLTSPTFIGTLYSQNIYLDRDPEDSYRLQLRSRYSTFKQWNNAGTLKWDYHRNAMVGDITLTDQYIRNSMSLTTTGDLTIPGSYYGDGSHLTGISAPVTSVNNQTGAISLQTLYDPTVGLFTSIKKIVHNPVLYSGWCGDYVGDYFSGHGFNLTGLTVTSFSSLVRTDDQGYPVGWNVGFNMDFNQAFCDTYIPGYRPEDMRMIGVSMNPPSIFGKTYGVQWGGQSGLSNWTAQSGVTPLIIYTMNPNVNSMVARATAYFTCNEVVFVNGRYSPASWPYALFLRIWVAE